MTGVRTSFAVPDVHCDHCKQTLERAVGALDGVSGVAVDVPGRIVTVRHDPARASTARITTTVEEQGYLVAGSGEAA